MIAAAVGRWWVAPEWQWFKAQLWQESRLDPDAVSPVGAEGLAQFMPATWEKVSRSLGWGAVSRRDAKYAIAAGAWYMARLAANWSTPRPVMDRHFLAAASYNAGLGSMLAAQKACTHKPQEPPALYEDIVLCLPQVTGRHATETIDYVIKIKRWRAQMP